MANEWIPALASATLELIKPPYDYVCGQFQASTSKEYNRTQPQIPIRAGSTYFFAAQALEETVRPF